MFLQCFFCCICDDDQDINKKKTKKEKKREPKLLDKQQNKSHVSVRKIEEKKQNIAAKEYVEIQIKPKIQQNLLQVKQNKDVKHDIQEPAIPPFIKHQENIGQSMQNKIKRQRSSGKIIKQSSLVYGNSEKIFRIGALQSSKKQVQKKIAVNKRIDNSWRQQQSDNQQSTTFDQRIRKQGLPNMGNTCYLNSIIQFLFAAQKLISIIQKISQNKPNSFHYRLTQIFRSIGQHHKLSMKQIYLLAIIQDLIGYQPQFKPFQQNDSLQCLLTILNMLQNEDASSSKLNYFKLKYSFTCECKDNQNLMHESLHIQSRQKCSTCKKYFGIIIYSSPIYLIVIPDRELQEYMSFSKMNGEKIIYQCKAFVSYFGNRSKGHYIAHRKINDKSWICLNDSKVSPIENVKDINYIPRYCLYQFKKRISNKPLQKI